MINNLRDSFFQVFTGTIIWVSFLLTIFKERLNIQEVTVGYLWNIIGIGIISALLFGIMYNVLWNHLTLKPVFNIVISSICNTLGGFTAIWLISKEIFEFISNWTIVVFALTLILHTIAFYFYARYENKKDTDKLNKVMSKAN